MNYIVFLILYQRERQCPSQWITVIVMDFSSPFKGNKPMLPLSQLKGLIQFFEASALWADAFIELLCVSICLLVPSFRLFFPRPLIGPQVT